MSLTQNLQRGSKGEDVKKVQNFLGITADGDFGPNTEAAVREYQSENGLNVDGIVGSQTWASMGLDDEELTTLSAKVISVNTKSASDRLELKEPIVNSPKTLKKQIKPILYLSLQIVKIRLWKRLK